MDDMDLEYEQYSVHGTLDPVHGTLDPVHGTLDMNDMVISKDLSELVDSIVKEGGFPDSPPDSGSEHLLSPSSMVNSGSVGGFSNNPGVNISNDYYVSTNHQRNISRDYTSASMLPDLSKVNYNVPMQMIDEDYKVN